jgi:23S rRNA pseudouridine1911/1915/1917 synthase
VGTLEHRAKSEQLVGRIAHEFAGWRLDRVLPELFPDFSRTLLQSWIRKQQVLVDGSARRPRDLVAGGEVVTVTAQFEPIPGLVAEDLPLSVVYQDPDLLVVDKHAGQVVHPAAGNPGGTLVNALLNHCPRLEALPRAGLVHRLDKDTTGLLIIASSARAHKALVAALQARRIRREYEAVVVGIPDRLGTVDAPIARHPVDRKRMAVVRGGKPAVSHYRVMERYCQHSLLRVRLETGRTHQIRVHMTHIHHPLVGDRVYGRGRKPKRGLAPEVAASVVDFARQALHAQRLAFAHPVSGEPLQFESPLPADMAQLIDTLRLSVRGTDGR